MRLNDFHLEVYFDRHEFSAPYLLAQSDCESMPVKELLGMEPGSEELLLSTHLGYTEVGGSPALRELISGLYENIGPEDILTHAGAEEAIFAYMNLLLEKGDHVVCLFPAYQSLFDVARAEGAEVSAWPLRLEDGRWRADFDLLLSLLRPNTKLIAVNTPHNPTGFTFTESEMRTLCEIAEKRGIHIFSDEVYHGLELDCEKRPHMADLYDRAVSLGVLSKAYGLAGLRVGWLAGRDKALLSDIKKFKYYLSICNSSASETLAGVALRNGKALLSRNLKIVRENLAFAGRFFTKYSGLFVNIPPQCGPVAFHKINLHSPVEEFCETLVKEAGVLLLPASVYQYDGPFVRMGYGRRNFKECLLALDSYLERFRSLA